LPLLSEKYTLQSLKASEELLFGVDCGILRWIHSLGESFGCQLLLLLFATEHILKGFVCTLTGQASFFIFASYGVNAARMQIYSGVVQLPWSIKPVFGLISDVFPIGGFKKRPYMLLTSIFGVASMLAIGMLPQGFLSINGIVVCMVVCTTQYSVCDLLSEAAYAERIQDNPKRGPCLVSYVWGGVTVMSTIAVALSGCIIDYDPRLAFSISAFAATAVFLPLMGNYLQERKLTDDEVINGRARALQQKEVCLLCGIMLLANVSLTFTGLAFDNVALNATVAVIFTLILLFSFTMLLTPVVAKFNAFQLLQSACSLSISSASFYFYTDSPEEYPEGPHFSIVFYSSVLGFIGSCMSLLGVFCYQRYMSKWRYRSLLLFTNIFLFVLSMMDVVMFSRINLKIGIPDHYMVIGATISESLVAQWQWMPSVVILSYLCPQGLEATMYALLAGCASFGNIVANDLGALLLQLLECNPKGALGESRSYDNLWIAALISCLMPLVVIAALFWLIPDAKQDEKLLPEGTDASSGSLLRSWFGCSDSPPLPAAEAILERKRPCDL
jgi:folate/biopterin transporter